MSSDYAITIQNLNKLYHVYNKPQDRLKQSLFGRKKQYYREFRALNDVSFEVKKGETVGIIGRNGSGKSTLLQIIAGTLTPTSGNIQINGRVAALLELGSGFNPEFTGRENVYMSGAIYGLSRSEIDCKMPLIESFAEIGEFIDQPVKLYSSGMYLRLAFSSAIHVDPDILIVDEALAVGDMKFQLKCIEKMKSFKKQGKTILFVSHDTFTVRNFCDQAVWMMDGKVHQRGNVNVITENYQDFMKPPTEDIDINENAREKQVEKKEVLSIDNVRVVDYQDYTKNEYRFGEKVKVIVDYTLYKSIGGVVGGIALYDKQNTYICGLNTKLDGVTLPNKPGKYQLILDYDEINLLPGTYYVDVGFFESSAVVPLDYKSREKYFLVSSGEYFAEGLVYLKHEWSYGGTK